MDNISLAIIINLTLAIFTLSVGGAYSLKKLSKERNAYKDSLLKTKKKLRDALSQANKSSLTIAAPDMDNMVEELKAEIKERERVIDVLNAAQIEIEDAIKSISSDDELSSDEAKEKIASLIELNQTSSDMIGKLRDQIAAGYERIQKLTDANTASHISAEGKSNKKSNELNKKLVNTLRELTSKADLTGRSLKDSKLKLQMSKKIEQQLQAKIATLENKWVLTADESVLGELEQEIDDLKQELERTKREKELIEKHLLKMDKSLDGVDDVEEQLTRAQLEIETLEKYVAIFDDQLDEQNDNSKIEDLDDEDLDDEDVAMMSGDEAADLISTHDSGSEDTIEDMRTLPQSRTITNVAVAVAVDNAD
ncbi:MAG: chromosome segregation ATPase, partial [Oleiphilaceae bacterium]